MIKYIINNFFIFWLKYNDHPGKILVGKFQPLVHNSCKREGFLVHACACFSPDLIVGKLSTEFHRPGLADNIFPQGEPDSFQSLPIGIECPA